MPTKLTAFSGKPSHLQEVELDGVFYKVRFVWFKRPSSGGWFMSLLTQDEEPIWLNRRLTPQRFIAQHIITEPEPPPGLFLCRGPVNYRRETLGDELVVKYYAEGEFQELQRERGFRVF